MSLAREFFRRLLSGLARKARNTEDFGERVIANTKLLRRGLLYFGSGYCSFKLFQHWVIEHGSAEGASMYPTMSERTPFTLTSNLHSHGKNMRLGDLVNFTSPIFRGQPNGKRIVGMPGDYVVLDHHQAPSVGGAPVPGVTDWRSQTEIQNGVELKEREEPMMIEVPEGHIYAVGDNLSWSRDSRFFGPVPMALVNGKQIVHTHRGVFGGWQWTIGDQLRRIPKEEEDEYLRGYQQHHGAEMVEQEEAGGSDQAELKSFPEDKSNNNKK